MVLFQTGNPLRKNDGLHKYIVRLNYADRNVQYKRIERTVYGKDAAKNMELQLMESVKKEPSRASKMTVKDLYEQYMAAKKTEIRETTWDKSRRNLEKYIMPSIGEVKLSKLNAYRQQE